MHLLFSAFIKLIVLFCFFFCRFIYFTAYEIDANCHFKYCFMAIASSIEGWRFCRPNIAVNGTFLKCKYGGTLLTAATMDDHSKIFPLAFSIVDSENNASWK